MRFILGKKIGMSEKFQGDEVVPITLIKAGPCVVTQIKNNKDNNEIIQIGFEKLKAKKIKKPQQKTPFRFFREFKISPPEADQPMAEKYKIGDEIKVDIFKSGDKVVISGRSKGKGFAGVMKRHGFSGMPETHGTKHDHRHAGSIGSTAFQRVVKGKKMAGRMGNERITIKNLEIIEVNLEKNILAVSGSVPGARGSLLEIKSL